MSASLPLIGIILKNATIKGNYVGSKSQCAELFTMMQQGKVSSWSILHETHNITADVSRFYNHLQNVLILFQYLPFFAHVIATFDNL